MANNIDYLKGKVPGEESGIEIRHSVCDICTPGMHCGLDVYVKDGKIIKVEGTKEHPQNKGKLCTKGAANRQYLYRDDRLLTPLKRVGERGEGKFEPISWEEAIDTIGEKLMDIKDKHGPDRVAFYSGYSKWYRFMFRRFANAFGTQNYGTESSSCFTSGVMAWQTIAQHHMLQDMANTDLFIGWGTNSYFSRFPMVGGMEKGKERGMKLIVVDPRITPTTKRLADLHLRPHLGTDGALALSIANVLISNGWIDKEFIEKYVYGYEEYAAYVAQFPPQKGQELTGVPAADIIKAAEMIHQAGSCCITESSAPMGHHTNGMQNYRAIMSLLVITGNFDKKGGQKPITHTFMERDCGFVTREEHFMEEKYPHNGKPAIGAKEHPLWYELRGDMQANDLAFNILRQDEESVKAIFALGMNYRMFSGDNNYLEAFKKLDFFVDVDLFMTDTAKWADIVLPACTSMERGELKTYPGQFIWYTNPVVEPLGESKSDCDILTLLANRMGIDDELLCGGYEKCIEHIIQDLPVTIDQLKASPHPIKLQGIPPYRYGSTLEKGLDTPTGKLELYSKLIADNPQWGLDALPTYTPPFNPDKEKYPFLLCAGTRIPNALHSRLHDMPWERHLLPEPSVEMSMEDADEYGIELGDDVEVVTNIGSLTFKAIPTATVQKGEIYIYHGYRELDINSILDGTNLDPYSGFPAYRSAFCYIRRK